MDEERIDDLGHGLKIIQRINGFRFGIDAVLLSHFATIKKNDHIVDFGTGSGVIPILLCDKHKNISVTGIEIQEKYTDMALRSVALNDMSDRIKIINADLKDAPDILGYECCDVVITNPPYRKVKTGITSPIDERAIARHEFFCTLSDIIETSGKLLKYGGRLTMIHLPERLTDIMYEMRIHSLEPKRMRFVCPKINTSPSLVLIECIKGGGVQLNVLPPLIVYDENGRYTDEILDIYS